MALSSESVLSTASCFVLSYSSQSNLNVLAKFKIFLLFSSATLGLCWVSLDVLGLLLFVLDSAADSWRNVSILGSHSVGLMESLLSSLMLILLLMSSFSSRLSFGDKVPLSHSPQLMDEWVDNLLSRFFPIRSLFSFHSSTILGN